MARAPCYVRYRYGSKAALTQIPTGLGSPNVHQDVLDVWRVAHLLIVA